MWQGSAEFRLINFGGKVDDNNTVEPTGFDSGKWQESAIPTLLWRDLWAELDSTLG